jgi:hypothetical protein
MAGVAPKDKRAWWKLLVETNMYSNFVLRRHDAVDVLAKALYDVFAAYTTDDGFWPELMGVAFSLYHSSHRRKTGSLSRTLIPTNFGDEVRKFVILMQSLMIGRSSERPSADFYVLLLEEVLPSKFHFESPGDDGDWGAMIETSDSPSEDFFVPEPGT